MSDFASSPVSLPSPLDNTQRYRPDSSGAKRNPQPRLPRPKNRPEEDADEEPKHQLDVEG